MKRFPLPSSQTMCAHCLHAHQHGFLPSFPPTLRAWLSGVFVEGGCEQKRQAQCRGVSGKPPAPKMLFSILPLPLSSTALQRHTPQPPDDASKQNQPTGSSLRRAWSSQGRSMLGNESTLKLEVGPLPAVDSPQGLQMAEPPGLALDVKSVPDSSFCSTAA